MVDRIMNRHDQRTSAISFDHQRAHLTNQRASTTTNMFPTSPGDAGAPERINQHKAHDASTDKGPPQANNLEKTGEMLYPMMVGAC